MAHTFMPFLGPDMLTAAFLFHASFLAPLHVITLPFALSLFHRPRKPDEPLNNTRVQFHQSAIPSTSRGPPLPARSSGSGASVSSTSPPSSITSAQYIPIDVQPPPPPPSPSPTSAPIPPITMASRTNLDGGHAPPRYVCEGCTYTTNDKLAIQIHTCNQSYLVRQILWCMMRQKYQRCPECHVKMDNMQACIFHRRRAHFGLAVYLCTVCDAAYVDPLALQFHAYDVHVTLPQI